MTAGVRGGDLALSCYAVTLPFNSVEFKVQPIASQFYSWALQSLFIRKVNALHQASLSLSKKIPLLKQEAERDELSMFQRNVYKMKNWSSFAIYNFTIREKELQACFDLYPYFSGESSSHQ